MKAPEILDYQKALKALGYDPGPLDGVWGPRTAAAALGLATELRCQSDDIRKPELAYVAGHLVRLRAQAPAVPLEADDVSGWQEPQNMDYPLAWDSGVVAVIVKRSQGLKVMPSGAEHAKLIAQTPIHRGDYHYASFTTKAKRSLSGADAQAETFAKAVGELKPGDLIPWLDVEWRSIKDKVARALYYRTFKAEQLTEWTLRWLERVEGHLGVRPGASGVYTLRSYAQHRLTNDPELARHPLWLAGAGGPKLSPVKVPELEACNVRTPEPWPSWNLYQWTGRGKVPWYRKGKGKIDRNVINGPLEPLLVDSKFIL